MQLRGVMPPVTTPFLDGDLAVNKLKENLRLWNRTAMAGYVILGSNGEAVSLSEAEKMEVLEAAREAIPETKLMVVGTGHESTRETIRFTQAAARLGADYALVVTPAYFRGSMRPQVLQDHFTAVAEASPIGILLYNVPKFTGLNMPANLVARLSEHPNILGIKDSSGHIGQLSEIIHLSKGGFAVFVGSAPVFFPALCVGAVGGILAVANAAPEACLRIQARVSDGRLEEARELQNRLTPLAKAVTEIHGIGGLKRAMDLAGYFGGDPRAPLKSPGPEIDGDLERMLALAAGEGA